MPAIRGLSLAIKELKRIDESIAVWSEQVVRPLRAVRRWLKTDSGRSFHDGTSLRERVLNLELIPERGRQQRMNDLLPAVRTASDLGLCASELQRCARMHHRELDPPSLRALQSLWVAANPGRDVATTLADWPTGRWVSRRRR